MKTSKILLTVALVTTSMFSLSAMAKETWEPMQERNAIQQSESSNGQMNTTALYFDTGRVCESRSRSGTDCSNWDVNPMQANFFVEMCRKYSEDKDFCDWYVANKPKLK